jgi:hypothetical protein
VNSTGNVYGIMDYIFLFLFVGLTITPVMFAFMVQTHPIFLVVNILLVIIMFIVMPVISNMVRSVWMAPMFEQYASGGGGSHTYPIMTAVFTYLPVLVGGISLILSIAMFVKGREG